jgi:hypothetical protein
MKPSAIADLIQTAYPAGSVEAAWDVLLILSQRRHGPDARLPRALPSTNPLTWRRALRTVCEVYDVAEADLLGRSRIARIAQARFALQTVLVERMGLATKEVARLTRRDWHTVQNARESLRRNTPQWQTLTAALDGRLHPEPTH